MHPAVRWGLPVVAVVAVILSLVLLTQRAPGTVGPTSVPENWETALATDLQDRDWRQPPAESSWTALRGRIETASAQTQNPAVQALLGAMLEASSDRASFAGPDARDRMLGLALDIVGRRDGVLTVRAQAANAGAQQVNVATSSRLPHVWEGQPASLDLQGVPRWPRIPVRSYGATACGLLLLNSATGERTGESVTPTQPANLQASTVSIEPSAGPGASPIRFSATLAGPATVRLLAWAPQLNRGVWLDRGADGTWSGSYTLPALPPGPVEWRFLPVSDDCAAGQSASATYTIR